MPDCLNVVRRQPESLMKHNPQFSLTSPFLLHLWEKRRGRGRGRQGEGGKDREGRSGKKGGGRKRRGRIDRLREGKRGGVIEVVVVEGGGEVVVVEGEG